MPDINNTFVKLAVFFCAWLCSQTLNCWAEDEDAVEFVQTQFVFDLDLQALMTTDLGQILAKNEFVKVSDISKPYVDVFESNNVSRISGLIHVPDSVADLVAYAEQIKTPGFLVRVKFANETIADSMFKHLESKFQPKMVDGHPYFKLPGQPDVAIGLKQISKNQIEIGSEKMLFQERRKFVSKSMGLHWKQLPKCPFRITLDLDGSRSLVDEIGHLFRPMVSPEFVELFDVVDSVKVISICIDPSSETLMNADLQFDQSSADSLSDHKAVLDGALYVWRTKLNDFFDEDGDTEIKIKAKHFKSEQLKNRISFQITKPKDFDSTILAIVGKVFENSENNSATAK